MTSESCSDLESPEEIEGQPLNDLVEEERRRSAGAADRGHRRAAEAAANAPTTGPVETEFTCRGCHLIFARSCLADSARSSARTSPACAVARGAHRRELLHVTRVHHPCPACGALLMAPEREEVSCGFVCPACRVHLMMRGGHLHPEWIRRGELLRLSVGRGRGPGGVGSRARKRPHGVWRGGVGTAPLPPLTRQAGGRLDGFGGSHSTASGATDRAPPASARS
jgi:hypothetical protein